MDFSDARILTLLQAATHAKFDMLGMERPRLEVHETELDPVHFRCFVRIPQLSDEFSLDLCQMIGDTDAEVTHDTFELSGCNAEWTARAIDECAVALALMIIGEKLERSDAQRAILAQQLAEA